VGKSQGKKGIVVLGFPLSAFYVYTDGNGITSYCQGCPVVIQGCSFLRSDSGGKPEPKCASYAVLPQGFPELAVSRGRGVTLENCLPKDAGRERLWNGNLVD
jgi:hypothetical protein